jgi:hypothetical protein
MDSTAREARRLLVQRRKKLARLLSVSEGEERVLRGRRSPDWVDEASEAETERRECSNA